MTSNQEILEKAIRKAIDGGWLPYFATFDNHMNAKTIRFIITEGSSDIRFEVVTKGRVYGVSGYTMETPSIIFNHDFAKALWGEQKITDLGPANADGSIHGIDVDTESGWRYHLQRMVIADDAIKYLGENI